MLTSAGTSSRRLADLSRSAGLRDSQVTEQLVGPGSRVGTRTVYPGHPSERGAPALRVLRIGAVPSRGRQAKPRARHLPRHRGLLLPWSVTTGRGGSTHRRPDYRSSVLPERKLRVDPTALPVSRAHPGCALDRRDDLRARTGYGQQRADLRGRATNPSAARTRRRPRTCGAAQAAAIRFRHSILTRAASRMSGASAAGGVRQTSSTSFPRAATARRRSPVSYPRVLGRQLPHTSVGKFEGDAVEIAARAIGVGQTYVYEAQRLGKTHPNLQNERVPGLRSTDRSLSPSAPRRRRRTRSP